MFAGGLNRQDSWRFELLRFGPLGSVRLVTKIVKVQTFSAKYLPYGLGYGTSGSESFQCKYLDSQSGRFISADIQPPNYVNPQSLNRYPYALNNPNRNVDPDGRMFYDVNDWGVAVAGGIKAVTRGTPDKTSTTGSGGHEFSREMLRQISLQLQLIGLPPSQVTSATTTTTVPTSVTVTVKPTQNSCPLVFPSAAQMHATSRMITAAGIVMTIVGGAVGVPEIGLALDLLALAYDVMADYAPANPPDIRSCQPIGAYPP